MESFVKMYDSDFLFQLSILYKHRQRYEYLKSLSALAYDNALFYKGFLLHAATNLRQLASRDSASAKIYNQLSSKQFLIDREKNNPINERSEYLPQWEAEAVALEKELIKAVPGFGEAIRPVKWQEVQARLQPGEAAVEFVSYRLVFPKSTDSILYAALLLLPGDTMPRFIPLFEEKDLAPQIELARTAPDKWAAGLYRLDDRGARLTGENLYQLIWKPLEPLLAGAKKIWYSPAGLLHRVNLDAIETPAGLLADRYNLVQVGSTRQLVSDQNKTNSTATAEKTGTREALLYGGIYYQTDTLALQKALAGLDSTSIVMKGAMHFSYTDSTDRGAFQFEYLKGSEQEVREAKVLLDKKGIAATLCTGYEANEEFILRTGENGRPSPGILHLSTHGFFLSDPEQTLPGTLGNQESALLKYNPMIRSGLLLAGCEQAWVTGKPAKPGLQDGILTASEVSHLNLRNTELVILSACETGLGHLSGNEGVYGLQRAFRVAGARYLIMTLWEVRDDKSREFLTLFYQKWLSGKKEVSIPDAFRAAQSDMRRKYPDNPYFWAGFILVE